MENNIPDNWEITRRVFEEVWNQKNLKVVDELMAADYVHHDPSSPTVVSGIDGYKQFVIQYLNAFHDLHFTIKDHVTEGETTASAGRSPAPITEICRAYPEPDDPFRLRA